MKQLPISNLKGCPYVEASLCSLLCQGSLVGKLGSMLNMSHSSPWSRVGGRTRDGRPRARATCEPGLLLSLTANTTLLVWGWVGGSQVSGSKALRVGLIWLHSFCVCSPHSQHWHPRPGRNSAGARGAAVGA